MKIKELGITEHKIAELSAEVIKQALIDLSRPPEQIRKSYRKKTVMSEKRRLRGLRKLNRRLERIREASYLDSKEWFKDKSREPFGYYWCLNMCRVNPNYIRKEITRADGRDGFVRKRSNTNAAVRL